MSGRCRGAGPRHDKTFVPQQLSGRAASSVQPGEPARQSVAGVGVGERTQLLPHDRGQPPAERLRLVGCVRALGDDTVDDAVGQQPTRTDALALGLLSGVRGVAAVHDRAGSLGRQRRQPAVAGRQHPVGRQQRQRPAAGP